MIKQHLTQPLKKDELLVIIRKGRTAYTITPDDEIKIIQPHHVGIKTTNSNYFYFPIFEITKVSVYKVVSFANF